MLISISAVTAADDTNNIISSDNAFNDVLTVNSNDNEILNATDSGTFQALNTKVNSGSAVITLENNYSYTTKYNDGYGVEINNANTIIDGNGFTIDGKGQSRMFQISVEGVTLKNIRFVNGLATYSAGAIYFSKEVTFINCTFINNVVTGTAGGGALYGYGIGASGAAKANIYNCTFINNSATSNGGAIYFRGVELNIDGCTFENNSATGSNKGGAIYLYSSSNGASITNSNFTNNKANYGAAIDIYSGQSYGTDVLLSRNIYLNNTITGNTGSAIYIESMANINITDSIFSNPKTQVYSSNSGYATANYNWWGNTFDNYTTRPTVSNVNILNWYYLDLPYSYKYSTVNVSLNNLYTTSPEGSSKHQSKLPTVTFNLSAVDATIDDNVTLVNGEATLSFVRSEPIAYITASYETSSYTKQITELLGDFQILQNIVDDESLSVIELDRDYNYTIDLDTVTTGVKVTRNNLVIDGKGFTIDAKEMSRIFEIRANNITLKNINFINGKCTHAGSVYFNGNGIRFINCNFTDSESTSNPGGALYVVSTGDVNFDDCSFISCTSYSDGGAVFLFTNDGLNYNFNRCVFIDNYANNNRGFDIYTRSYGTLNVNNSIFINSADDPDYAIYPTGMTTYNIDNNWWGNTADNYNQAPIYVNYLTPDNWYYLDVTPSSTGKTVEISLKKYNSTDASYNLPPLTFNVQGVNLTVGQSKVTLDENGKATISYSNPVSETGSVTVSYRNIELTKDLNLVMGDFDKLNRLISTSTSSLIELDRDYTYTVGVDEITTGIVINNENVVIDGKGHTIDAKGMSRVFYYKGYNVTLKNMEIVNAKSAYAGAIYVYGDVLYIDNCTFINNTATGSYGGGAFYAAHDYYMAITNSKFINNTAYIGGALVLSEYTSSGRTDVVNTIFTGNKATYGGGAICAYYGEDGSKENIVGCTFVNNTAPRGSAIYNYWGAIQNIRASIFLNNSGTIIDASSINAEVYANNNWFGNTYDNMSDKADVGSKINMTKWLYFDVIPNSDSTLTVSINNVYDEETGETGTYSTNYMPSINVTLSGQNINLDETEVTLDNHGKAIVDFTLTDDASVTGKYYGDIQVTKEITYGPFARLQDLISRTPDNSVIELTQDYVWGPGDTITEGIVFYDKTNITIIGNGHKVDAAGHSRVFAINQESTDITLKDLYIVNGYKNYDDGETTEGFDGAGLVNLGVNTKLINCTFFNNTAKSLYGGGAICWIGDYGGIINCTFENNTQLAQNGGAIYLDAQHVDIENTEFINNTAKGSLGGGAIFIRDGNNQIVNCSFYDNSAKAGGAVREYFDTNKTKIVNSKFIRNVATSTEYGGGAIMGNDPQVFNSVFLDNEAQYGAAIYADFNATVDKSVFINNTARSESIIFLGDYGNVTNSIFLNNSPEIGYIISNPWANATADYNWYGNTDKNYNQTPWVSNLVNMTKWVFLNATTPTFDGDNNNFTTKFNLMVYDSETQTAENFDSNRLPAFELTLTSQNLTLAENNAIIGEDVEANMTYYTGYLKAQYENVEYIIPFKYQLPSWIEADPVTVNVTKTKKLNFTVYPFDESTDFLVERGRVTFEVEDPSIASVEIKNRYFVHVKGLKVGVTNITIKYNGLNIMGEDMYLPSNATITVNVTIMPTSISLISDMPEKLYVSDSGSWLASLSPSGASGITFTSSNPDILNITGYGSSSCNYKAKQEGKVNVTISYAGTEEYAPCSLVYEIEVVKKDTFIEVENEYIELNISETPHWSYATLQPLNSHNLNYTSDNPEVATVAPDGNSFKINPLSVGIANITISYAGNDVYKPCEAYVIVNVTGVETHFEVNSTIAVNVSQGKSMEAKLIDEYGNQKIFPYYVTYTSNDTSIVNVTQSGWLEPLEEGVVNITIEFTGKDEYLPTKTYVIVTSSKVDTRIEINETIDVFVDDSTSKINLTVIDEYGNVVSVWPSNPIDYTSNDTDVVVISTSGRIYPQKEGVAKVNVTFNDVNQFRSSNATVIINVKRHASDIDVADVVEMYVTDTTNLNASVVKTGNVVPTINYASNDTSVVEIMGTNGNIKANGVGIANITVNFTGDRLNLPCVKYVKVIVTQIETSIEVIGNQDLKVGDEGKLYANLTPGDAGNLKYTSNNPNIVTVDSDGNFIAVGEGIANITVETDLSDKYTKSVEYVIFNVTRISTSIDVNETFDIFVDESKSVEAILDPSEAGALNYSSADGSIVNIDSTGRITGVKVGTTEITISYEGSYKYLPKTVIATVNVIYVPTQIKVNKTVGLQVTNVTDLEAIVIDSTGAEVPGSAADVTYTSNNASIVNVENGVITALAAGNATITIEYSGNNKYANCSETVTVMVYKAEIPTEIIANETIELYVKDIKNIEAEITPFNAGKNNLVYQSNDESIVTVDSEGNIHALKTGTTTIFISFPGNDLYNASNATVTVNVALIPIEISVENTTIIMDFNTQNNVNATLNHPEAGKLNYITNDTTVVTVNKNGKLIAVGAGNAKVTVEFEGNENYTSDELTVNVIVNKVDSTIKLNKELVVLKYGGYGYVTYTVTGGSVGLDNIEVVGHPEAVISISGRIISISGLDAGNYTLKVNTTPDGNHNSVETTVNVTVNKVDSTIKLNKELVVLKYGGYGYVTYTVTGGSVGLDNIEVVGHPEAVISISGRIISISGLDAGNYTLKVNTTPDGNHNSVETTVNVTVNKVDSTIKFRNDIVFDYRSSGSTTMTLKGVTVKLSDIEVVGHPEAKITLKNKVITVSNLEGGNYTLKVVPTPDDNHNPVIGTLNITVIAVNTTVEVPSKSISMKVGDTNNVNATLNPSEAGNLIYSSTNPDVVIVDSTGKITAVGEGSGGIFAKFKGNGKYLASKVYVRIKVSKITTEITSPSEISLYVDDVNNVNATISPDAGNLKYSVDDDSILSIDDTGAIIAKKEGTAKINISFDGDYKYGSSQRIVDVTVSRIPTKIIVENKTMKVDIGYGMPIRPNLMPSSSIGVLVYESSNPNVVEVDNTGFIYAVNSGSAKVTISFEGDYKYKPSNVTIFISVKPRVTNITVINNITLFYGDSVNLNATLNYPNENDKLYYVSGHPNYVSVDQTGQITALKTTGGVIVFVKFNKTSTFYGSSARVNVTVLPKETQMVVDTDYVSLSAGDKKSIDAIVINGPSSPKLSYITSNPDVAVVDKYGEITAVGNGVAVITVSYAGGRYYTGSSADITVNVSSIPTEIIVNDSVSMSVGDTKDLNAILSPDGGDLTYISSNEAVVKVDANGKLTAVKQGSAIITISYAGNERYDSSVKNVTVSVSKIPTSIDVAQSFIVQVEEVKNLNAVLSPNAGKLTYLSSNEGIVKVDAAGNIVGVNAGNATVTIKFAGNSKYVKSTATVNVEVVKIDLSNVSGVIFDVSPQETTTPSYSIEIPEDATGTLEVVIDGNSTYTAEIVDGKATVDIPDLAKGEHTVTVTYSGNYKYMDLSKSSVISNPIYKLDKNKDVTMVDGKGTYVVHLTKNTQAVEGKSIKFTINNEIVRYAETDSLGYARLALDDLPASSTPYDITAEYEDVKVSNKIYFK